MKRDIPLYAFTLIVGEFENEGETAVVGNDFIAHYCIVDVLGVDIEGCGTALQRGTGAADGVAHQVVVDHIEDGSLAGLAPVGTVCDDAVGKEMVSGGHLGKGYREGGDSAGGLKGYFAVQSCGDFHAVEAGICLPGNLGSVYICRFNVVGVTGHE